MKLEAGYANEEEMYWYNNDLEFMRHHKRTLRNMRETLDELLASNSPRITQGVKQDCNIYITDVQLNKACSLLHVWWNRVDVKLNNVPVAIPANHRDHMEEWQMKELMDSTVRIQKNLDGIVPYIRGQICSKLGLRMAPELRFYKDDR